MSRRSGEASQPVRRQGQELLVYHNLFLEKTEEVLYVRLKGKTQKMVALCVSICGEYHAVVAASVFRHSAATLIAELLHRDDPINPHQYVQALKKLEQI